MRDSTLAQWLHRHAYLGGVFVAILVFASAWVWFGVYQPPTFFPVRTVISIPEGTSLKGVAEILKNEQVIRNEFAYRIFVKFKNKHAQVIAGDYYFDSRLTMLEVVQRTIQGDFGLEPIRVTVPEGSTTYQMADVFEGTFEKFDAVSFTVLTEGKEGYLFPDTYFFLPNVTTSEIVQTLERTFYERLRDLETKIAAFGKPVHEIVTMASLLEKEAWKYDDRQMIAGVLWKRLEIGMPLQVDAVFGYIERTDTFSPRYSDLETDSTYNTYKYTGLPPGPIGSPSFEALEAAVTPVPTEALFYLHGRDGVLRIAKTYDEHLVNRKRFLD
jgi:UPF0755 protein